MLSTPPAPPMPSMRYSKDGFMVVADEDSVKEFREMREKMARLTDKLDTRDRLVDENKVKCMYGWGAIPICVYELE